MQKGMEPEFICDENGNTYAINLSSDSYSEHENGIKGIRSYLGINSGTEDESSSRLAKSISAILNRAGSSLGLKVKEKNDKFGIRARMVRIFNQSDFFFEKGNTHTCLSFEPRKFKMLGWKNYGLDRSPKTISAAWDGESFGIVVANRYQKFLEELYNAFAKKDAAVYFGGSRLLMPSGLIVAIASRIPKEIMDLGVDFLVMVQLFHDCDDNWSNNGLSDHGKTVVEDIIEKHIL